jgi:hypothetical protein
MQNLIINIAINAYTSRGWCSCLQLRCQKDRTNYMSGHTLFIHDITDFKRCSSLVMKKVPGHCPHSTATLAKRKQNVLCTKVTKEITVKEL